MDAERLCLRGRRRPEKSVSHWGRNLSGEGDVKVSVRMCEGLEGCDWVGVAMKERIWRGRDGRRDGFNERNERRFWRGWDSVVQEGLRYPYPQCHYRKYHGKGNRKGKLS
jgi:hypothetical protein